MPYSSMEKVNLAIKGIKPPVTLEQANAIGYAADGMEKAEADVKSPFAVAISNFKKGHIVEDGKWVKKQSTEAGEKELMCGVKAVSYNGKKYVILETMNAFIDREKQIFSTQSIEDYLEFVDGIGRKDRVRYHHIPGSEFASVVWQGMVGRFLVEVADVDDTAYGRKMFDALQNPQDYSEMLPEGWGTSHGYLYRRKDCDDGVYSKFVKFESTVLPAHRASNPYGKVGTKEKEVTMAGTKNDLIKLVGKELAEEVLKLTGEKSEDLETEVDFKEKDDDTGDDTAAGEKDDGEFYEFEVGDDFFKEVAKHVPQTGSKEILAGVKEVLDEFRQEVLDSVSKLIADSVGSKEKLVKDSLAGKITLRPFTASADNGNIVEGAEVEKAEKAKKRRRKDRTEPMTTEETVDYAVEHLVLGPLVGKT